jgi:hypothetical protein
MHGVHIFKASVSSPKCPEWLWSPPISSLFGTTLFPYRNAAMDWSPSLSLHLVPKLRISGVIPPLRHLTLWYAKEKKILQIISAHMNLELNLRRQISRCYSILRSAMYRCYYTTHKKRKWLLNHTYTRRFCSNWYFVSETRLNFEAWWWTQCILLLHSWMFLCQCDSHSSFWYC